MENSMKTLTIFRIWARLAELYWADFILTGLDPVTDNSHYTNHLITETSPYLLQHARPLVIMATSERWPLIC